MKAVLQPVMLTDQTTATTLTLDRVISALGWPRITLTQIVYRSNQSSICVSQNILHLELIKKLQVSFLCLDNLANVQRLPGRHVIISNDWNEDSAYLAEFFTQHLWQTEPYSLIFVPPRKLVINELERWLQEKVNETTGFYVFLMGRLWTAITFKNRSIHALHKNK